MNMPFDCFRFALILALLGFSIKAYCEKFNGRFTFGGYTSTERFADDTGTGSINNDFQTLSARFFLNVEGLRDSRWDATVDLRDKHDFFDKLDREKLELSARNEFQTRQLSIKNSKPENFWAGQMGRFPLPEAGSAYVDGGQVETHWSKSLSSSVFAGLNPKKDWQSYVASDSHAQIKGVHLSYQNHDGGWDKNFFTSNAYIEKTTDGFVDRRYFFHNLNYQWNTDSRVITFLYYDLVPRSYIQNGNFIWQQGWTPTFQTELNSITLDVIEYSRRQSVLERLSSSPYSESSAKFNFKTNNNNDRLYFQATSGRRAVDGLSRQEMELGYNKSRIFSPNWDCYVVLGTRHNFTSDDTLLKLGTGYFSNKWEWNLDLENMIQKNVNGTTTHPLQLETSLSYYLSRSTYMSFAGESASDEDVKIFSAFFRIGYRFGNREIPPVRDGAAPRGSL